ncbi:hypothetical protein NLJ89_g8823 [Agrocybe chaxingu]|uniref:Uncharacterized protein n=1 Tax=Agrocybe chaxingu TaxID=84603 RepID=A0A9W8K1R4_9AGAR|nr:hypothetical protein NLJ89_g8823 [Agrocybe chaxingu]
MGRLVLHASALSDVEYEKFTANLRYLAATEAEDVDEHEKMTISRKAGLHILLPNHYVKLPFMIRATKQRRVESSSLHKNGDDASKKHAALATVNELGRFLDQPLHERAKIPADQYRFDSLISTPSQLDDMIGPQDLEKLFRVDEQERAEGLYCLFYSSVMDSPPPSDGTENAFISFWDGNIRRIT